MTCHWDVIGCFIWDLFETSKRRTDETSLLRSLETLSQCSNKMWWRRTTEASWRRSTETSLRRTERRRYDVATTSYFRVDTVTEDCILIHKGWISSLECVLQSHYSRWGISSSSTDILLKHMINMLHCASLFGGNKSKSLSVDFLSLLSPVAPRVSCLDLSAATKNSWPWGRCYIGRLLPMLDENVNEIMFPFTFNPSIISFTLTLTIKTGNSIVSSECIKEG